KSATDECGSTRIRTGLARDRTRRHIKLRQFKSRVTRRANEAGSFVAGAERDAVRDADDTVGAVRGKDWACAGNPCAGRRRGRAGGKYRRLQLPESMRWRGRRARGKRNERGLGKSP